MVVDEDVEGDEIVRWVELEVEVQESRGVDSEFGEEHPFLVHQLVDRDILVVGFGVGLGEDG